MALQSTKFSAPGKVILFGEHSVVYGHPAIATAVGLRAYCEVRKSDGRDIILSVPLLFNNQLFVINENSVLPPELESLKHVIMLISNKHVKAPPLNITITSDIPYSAGLGSSAATSVSLVASLLEYYKEDYNLNLINEIAFESEKITHGTPSGIDNTISTYGGGLLYENGIITPIASKLSSSFLLIIESGVSRNTKDIVEKVRKMRVTNPDKTQSIFNKISEITRDAKKHLESGNIKAVGTLMNENHEQLVKLGVSTPILNNIIDLIDNTNALGRKITGAGGGGSIIALYDNFEYAKEIAMNFTENLGYVTYPSKIFQLGVRIEEQTN